MISDKKFQKKVENFKCENCGHETVGDGYTNHCSNCLWSKHVDVNPGDRASTCFGLMRPAGLIKRGDILLVVHRCLKCGLVKRNKVAERDNFDQIVKISRTESI